MSNRILILAVFAPFLLTLPPRSAAALDTRTPEQRMVQDLYGAAISKARATRNDPSDDAALAMEMLTVARDESQTAAYRAALAHEALALTQSLGSEDAARAAVDALNIIQQTAPVSSLRYAELDREIAVSRFNRSGPERLAPEVRIVLAQRAAEKLMAFADELEKAGKPAAARDEISRAREIVRPFNLTDLSEQLVRRQQELILATGRHIQVEQGIKALENARATGNQAAIKAAQVRLATMYLQFHADIPTAAKHIEGSEHPFEAALVKTAAYIDNPKDFPVQDIYSAAEGLANAADSIREEPQRKKVAAVGVRMMEVYLKAQTDQLEIAKARVLLGRLQGQAKMTEADKLMETLRENYGGIEGSLTVLDAARRRIRLTYRFESEKELADFILSAPDKTRVAGGAIVLADLQGTTMAEHKIIFDADQPISIAFRATTTRQIETIFNWAVSLPFINGNPPYMFVMGGVSGGRGSGGGILGPGVQHFNPQLNARPDVAHRMSIAWDGKGGILWLVNDQKIAETTSQFPDPRPAHLRLMLRSIGASTSWGNIVIEGAVVLDPLPQRPAEPPAQSQPAD